MKVSNDYVLKGFSILSFIYALALFFQVNNFKEEFDIPVIIFLIGHGVLFIILSIFLLFKGISAKSKQGEQDGR